MLRVSGTNRDRREIRTPEQETHNHATRKQEIVTQSLDCNTSASQSTLQRRNRDGRTTTHHTRADHTAAVPDGFRTPTKGGGRYVVANGVRDGMAAGEREISRRSIPDYFWGCDRISKVRGQSSVNPPV